MGKLLENKNIMIMGVRNKWSIAWGIAKSAMEHGANVIFTYLGEREKESLDKLLAGYSGLGLYPCDVTSDQQIDELFDEISREYGTLHGLVHAIAHAKTEDLQNLFVNTSRDGFLRALDISAYSLVAVSRKAKELMPQGGSIITLTYYGSEKVMPGYNVMGVAKAALEASVRYLAFDLGPFGIRVNAISAGPVKTMSAMGIQNFGDILEVVEKKSPLRKNITPEELGNNAVWLLSSLSDGITGQTIYVDSGYNILGI